MAYYSGVLFDSIDLTLLTDIYIHNVITENQIDKTNYSGKIARSDGIKHYGKSYGAKKITVQGHIGSSTREGFISARGTLFKTLETEEATLLIPIKNLPIIYTATVENTIISDSAGGYGSFEITFVCSDPFGYDRDLRTIVDGQLVTTASSDVSYIETVGGDYKTPIKFTLSFSSLTGSTGKYVTLTNEAGDYITVTRDWSNDDVLVVDMKNKTCKVNGASIDYTGYFWEAEVGDTTFNYLDNMTTRSVGIVATYQRRYL